ncbi:MAG TPA: alpha/beta hydrolase [Streptosporangiaceae bacterium]|nr:alpha/beta hydrolase [Streptosporangiaceae bacterium]
MPDLIRDGVRIHYEVSRGTAARGSGAPAGAEAPPVLLSHAFGETSMMWEPNLPALAAEHEVITWDMRGHGRSESPADPARYTQDACVADMAALLDECGAARAVLGGLSLGGYLSLAFWLAHPDRVAALMLFDTGPGFRNDEARQRWNERALKTADRLQRDGQGSAGSASGGHASAAGLALAARGMLTQRDGRVMECLSSIDVPVLVLVGADDQAFLGAADYVAAKVPDARHVVVPAAGHLCNMDQPEAFDQAVLKFLGALDGGR